MKRFHFMGVIIKGAQWHREMSSITSSFSSILSMFCEVGYFTIFIANSIQK